MARNSAHARPATAAANNGTAGEQDIFRLIKGYYTIRALLALWRLGLLERAVEGEDLHLTQIAAEHGCDPSALKPLFNYLLVRGFFDTVARDVYRLTHRGQTAGAYYGYLSTMVGGYEPVLARIEELATGRIEYGVDVERSHAEMTRGLTSLEDRLMGAVVEVVRNGRVRKVMDLGCGSGRMLSHMCRLGDHIQAVGVDLSADSCAVARETVEREGLQDRMTIIQGNAADIRSLPADVVKGTDVVTVMFLLHELLRQQGPDAVVRLIRDIGTVVGEQGRLVIVEVTGTSELKYNENLLFVPEYELLHEYTNQRLAPRSAWESMVRKAGLRVVNYAAVDM